MMAAMPAQKSDVILFPRKPNFKVVLLEEGGKHLYKVTFQGSENTHIFPGVTGVLDIIGGEKTQALSGWHAKITAERFAYLVKEKLSNGGITEEDLPGFIKESKKRPKQKKEEAADIGTRAHKAINDLILGIKPHITDDIAPAVEAFKKWEQETDISFIAGDTKVASISFRYGGSIDALACIGDDLVIVDFKSSNKIREEAALQVAAYAQAFLETYMTSINFGLVLRVGKNLPLEFETKQIKSLSKSFEAFKSAMDLSDSMGSSQYL